MDQSDLCPPACCTDKRVCKQHSRVPPCQRLCRDAQIECRPKRSKLLRVGVQQAGLHSVPKHSKDYSDNMLGCKMLCCRHEQSTLQCLHIAVANWYVTEVNLCTCYKFLVVWITEMTNLYVYLIISRIILISNNFFLASSDRFPKG